MSVIKQTQLDKPRSFKVLPGYTLHIGSGVICESGAVILAGTQETLDVIMSQKWKVVEQFPEAPVATPAPAVVPEPEPEPAVAPEPAFDAAQDAELDAEVEGDIPDGSQEKSKEEPKAQAAQKSQRSRRAR